MIEVKTGSTGLGRTIYDDGIWRRRASGELMRGNDGRFRIRKIGGAVG